MDLIDTFREAQSERMPLLDRNRNDDDQDGMSAAKILDLSKLVDLAEKVLKHHTVDKPGIEDNRKFIKIWDVELGNILGYVDDVTWVNQVESFIDWCIKAGTRDQANGQWKLYKFQHKMERRVDRRNRAVGTDKDGRPETMEVKTPRDYLIIAIQLIDVKGQQDMIYEGGRITTKKSLDTEALKELLKKQPQGNALGGVIQEQEERLRVQQEQIASQSEVIEQLRKEQNENRLMQEKTNDLMLGLMSQLKDLKGETAPVPKPTRRSKK